MSKLICLLTVLVSLLAAQTNAVKTYIIPPGSKLIYPDGTVFNTPWRGWLLSYEYGIGLRTDAQLWIDNYPILMTKLTNRESHIGVLEKKLDNRELKLSNVIMINDYNQDYMKFTHDVFGKPEPKVKWQFPVGLAIGLLLGISGTIGVGYVVGKSWRE